MVANLLVSLLLNAITFGIHTVGLVALTRWMSVFARRRSEQLWRGAAAIAVAASGLFMLLCLEIAIWAVVLAELGAFPDFVAAYYYSVSSFSTIGFGDVMPASEWQLLAALEGVTGFLLIGWTAAYLVTIAIRCGPFERDTHF